MEQPSSSSAIGDDQRDRDRDRDDRKKNKEQEAEREDSVTRALVEKIHQHKAKVTALLQQLEKEEEEQQNKSGSSSLYSLLESEIESMAPLFDLLEPRGLAAYLSGLAIMHGNRFPQELKKLYKHFGLKPPPTGPLANGSSREDEEEEEEEEVDENQRMERKLEKERLTALFRPLSPPTTPYLSDKERQQKEQEERAKELAKTPLATLIANELRSKQQRRHSASSAARFNEGLEHLKKQVLTNSPMSSRSSTPTSTPAKKRKPEGDDGWTASTPERSAPETSSCEPTSEPPPKRRRSGFAITRADPTSLSSPMATSSLLSPKTEPRRPRIGRLAHASMSPMASSPRTKRFGVISRTAASNSLVDKASRCLFADTSSLPSSLPSSSPACPPSSSLSTMSKS